MLAPSTATKIEAGAVSPLSRSWIGRYRRPSPRTSSRRHGAPAAAPRPDSGSSVDITRRTGYSCSRPDELRGIPPRPTARSDACESEAAHGSGRSPLRGRCGKGATPVAWKQKFVQPLVIAIVWQRPAKPDRGRSLQISMNSRLTNRATAGDLFLLRDPARTGDVRLP